MPVLNLLITVQSALHQLDGDHDDGLMYPSDKGSACLSRGVGLSDSKMETDLGDTGASSHLQETSFNSTLYDTERSKSSFHTAGEGVIRDDIQGKQDISVLNLDHQPGCPNSVEHTRTVTTVEGLGPSLWSLETEFRDHGYDIHLTHGYSAANSLL